MRNALFLALVAICISICSFNSEAEQTMIKGQFELDIRSQQDLSRYTNALSPRFMTFRAPVDLTLSEAIDYVRETYPIETSLVEDEDGLAPAFDRKGADCEGFIRDDGTYGPYGQVIAKSFKDYSHLNTLIGDDVRNARGLRQLCPNFKNLSKKERVKFWVWTFASIAWAESTCLPHATARGMKGKTAVGLVQMEARVKDRAWRGLLCKKFSEVKSPGPNLQCGLEVMRGQIEGEYATSKECPAGLIVPCSYWQKARRMNQVIPKLISLYPECEQSPVTNI